MIEDRKLEVRRVACPTCDAPAGQRCVTVAGRGAPGPHTDRIMIATGRSDQATGMGSKRFRTIRARRPAPVSVAPEGDVPDEVTSTLFVADLARLNAVLEKAGAVVTTADGFTYIDESKVPATFHKDPTRLVRAYRGLIQYGYANGLL